MSYVFMDEELDNADDQALAHECWYWSTVQDMAELLIANGRDKVMADVTEIVMSKLKQGYIPNVDV